MRQPSLRSPMKAAFRLVLGGALFAIGFLVVAGPTAGAAAFYAKGGPGIDVEVQSDNARIFALEVRAPVTCQTGTRPERTRSVDIADTSAVRFDGRPYPPIAVNRESGHFRFVERTEEG